MKAKVLVDDKFRILCTVEGSECPAEDFLVGSMPNYAAAQSGLWSMLEAVAAEGLGNVPSAWLHEANKQQKVYEFIKGDLRLFFFKGVGRDIAVCSGGVVKKGKKADKANVARTAKLRGLYDEAIKNGTLEIIDDEEDQ